MEEQRYGRALVGKRAFNQVLQEELCAKAGIYRQTLIDIENERVTLSVDDYNRLSQLIDAIIKERELGVASEV
jgi:DNA-binding XRE family transcriptional regulator